MITLSDTLKPFTNLFKSTPKPMNTSTWMAHQVSLISQLVWDAIGRLRAGIDGIDKTNKLMIAMLNGGMLWFVGEETPRLVNVSNYLWRVNGFFGAAGFFGRVQEATGYNRKTGRLLIAERAPLKAANIVFLAIGKGAEFLKQLQKLSLLPLQWFRAMDTAYLGSVASRIGSTSIGQIARVTTLAGTKDCFILLSASYAILDNLINLIDAKKWDAHTLGKIGLGVANDIGKMAMILWFYWFTVTWSFVAISTSAAVIGISKILFDSYTATGRPEFLK